MNKTTDSNPIPTDVKMQSVGWLLGKSLVLHYKFIKALKDSEDPNIQALVQEAKQWTGRWEAETRIR